MKQELDLQVEETIKKYCRCHPAYKSRRLIDSSCDIHDEAENYVELDALRKSAKRVIAGYILNDSNEVALAIDEMNSVLEWRSK